MHVYTYVSGGSPHSVESLELDNYHVGAGNLTWDLCQSSQFSHWLNHLSGLKCSALPSP